MTNEEIADKALRSTYDAAKKAYDPTRFPHAVLNAVYEAKAQAYEEAEARVSARLHANGLYPVNKPAEDVLEDVIEDIRALKPTSAPGQQTASAHSTPSSVDSPPA
jgi:predicted nucleic acid-binding protein